ncbi:MAG TPA: hypothetical protein VHL98_05890 [Microvirga sp.]|jgi:hypothetical protein|nr:hypothetical protein [Microvirga sp.]
MGNDRLAAHMGVSFILFLVAAAGWGAFAYGLSSDRQQERSLREELTRAAAERDRAGAEARQLRADLDRSRQALDQARRDLASAQMQVTTLTEQLRTRDRATSTGGATPAARSGAPPVQPARQAPATTTPRP